MPPDRAKSRIVVLGNLENRLWAKSEKYALVLHYSSLCLLTSTANENFRLIRKGDCNNAFYNAKLPADKTTIIKPPSGNPDAKKDVFWLLKKTLYGLGCSPRHKYRLVTSILFDMGLQPSLHDPCFFQGVPFSEASPASSMDKPLHLRLYVNDFVYLLEDASIKQRFERLLASKLRLEFMGTVKRFLGTHFEWSSHQDGSI